VIGSGGQNFHYRYSLKRDADVPPRRSSADQDGRIAGVAHFVMNQRSFIVGFRYGHETGCTDRVE
jgi:hypothetical protein